MKKTVIKTRLPVLTFTASVEREGKWYVGSIDEMQGVHSQGRTLKELEENLKDALALTIEVRRDIARKARKGKRRALPVAVEFA